MYISTATEDFRRAAERVRFSRENLIPVEEKKDCWRVPFQTQPELLTSLSDFAAASPWFRKDKWSQLEFNCSMSLAVYERYLLSFTLYEVPPWL